MNNIQRYITIQCIQTRDKELIPLWDKRISYEKHDLYGPSILVKDSWDNITSYVECIYDIKTKEISTGINIDYYPEKLKFKIGDEIYYEKNYRKLSEGKIKDIIYEEYELVIYKGNSLPSTYAKNIIVDKKAIYAVKIWKPFYILENNVKVEWEHKLYEKE